MKMETENEADVSRKKRKKVLAATVFFVLLRKLSVSDKATCPYRDVALCSGPGVAGRRHVGGRDFLHSFTLNCIR
jgi:hypothetical protein